MTIPLILNWLRLNWRPVALIGLILAAVLYVQGLRSDLESTQAKLTAAETIRDACLEGQKAVKEDLDVQAKAVEEIKQGAKEHSQAAAERAQDVLRAPSTPTPPPVTSDDWNAWLEAQR